MALFTQNPVTMIPPDQQSAGSTKGHAADLSSSSRSVKDPLAARLFAQSGSAVGSIQQQIDSIMGVLRSPIPQPDTYAVTDPNGNLIAWIGYNVVDNVVFQGGWFKQFYVGGTDAAHAVISSDAAGNVTINGATIILAGTGGTIVLDPSVPDITVTDLAGDIITIEPTRFTVFAVATNYQTRIENGVINVEDATTHKPAVQIAPDLVSMVGPAGSGTVLLQSLGDDGFVEVTGGSGAFDIKLDGTTGNISGQSVTVSDGTNVILLDPTSPVITVTSTTHLGRLGSGTVNVGDLSNVHARMDADTGSGGGSAGVYSTAGAHKATLEVLSGNGALCINGFTTQVVGPRLAAISAPSIATTTVTATAGAAYTATEQGMLNGIKTSTNQLNTDVVNLQTAVNDIRDRLKVGTGHGLTS